MWEKVKVAVKDDTKLDELKNYFIELGKDLQTPMGIPLHSIQDKASYDKLVSAISDKFFIKKSWL